MSELSKYVEYLMGYNTNNIFTPSARILKRIKGGEYHIGVVGFNTTVFTEVANAIDLNAALFKQACAQNALLWEAYEYFGNNLPPLGKADLILMHRISPRSFKLGGSGFDPSIYVRVCSIDTYILFVKTRNTVGKEAPPTIFPIAPSAPIAPSETEEVGNKKYDRRIFGKYGTGSCIIDIYSVLDAYKTGNATLDHISKKALNPGTRKFKDLRMDLVDIRDSAQRALDQYDAEAAYNETQPS